jgi:hypothetical protein
MRLAGRNEMNDSDRFTKTDHAEILKRHAEERAKAREEIETRLVAIEQERRHLKELLEQIESIDRKEREAARV